MTDTYGIDDSNNVPNRIIKTRSNGGLMAEVSG